MAVLKPDPELLGELDRASESGDDVEVVVQIKRAKGTRPDPVAICKAADDALRRAGEASSTVPGDVNVMASLATAYVRGPAGLIRELLAQPEIVAVAPNRPAGGVIVPPAKTTRPGPASSVQSTPRSRPPDHTA